MAVFPFYEWGIARVTGFLLAGVVPGVVTADENQAGITALIVVGSVQQICVEEESGSGFHFAIHVIEVFSGKGNALGVGPACVPKIPCSMRPSLWEPRMS